MSLWFSLFKSRFDKPTLVQCHTECSISELTQMAQRIIDTTSSEELCTEAMETLFRLQLLFGSEEEAEELLGILCRRYSKLYKKEARWLIAIQASVLELYRYRSGRASAYLQTIIIDEAPASLKLEAMTLLALAYTQNGQCEAAINIFDELTLASSEQADLLNIIDIVKTDVLGCTTGGHIPSIGHRVFDEHLHWRHALHNTTTDTGLIRSKFSDYLRLCQGAGASYWADAARIELSSRLLDADINFVEQLLRPILLNNRLINTHPRKDELLYSQAKILAKQGQHANAFHLLTQYIIVHEQRRNANLFFIAQHHDENSKTGLLGQALGARLPPRYRRLIGLIEQRINDPSFSVLEMAVFLNVSERALQMTFKRYLGFSPAQFIRKMRRQTEHAVPIYTPQQQRQKSNFNNFNRLNFNTPSPIIGAYRAPAPPSLHV